ncbi:unnamed protein product [Ranitomeya imitator]|uniref:Ribosomal protein S14 n=1 Tax=Ranitomeya imitator TaxID=111125 RepID=A0ABN9MCL6_9NEOB|nr:unnamed protein product [Ranitomeya imitator]
MGKLFVPVRWTSKANQPNLQIWSYKKRESPTRSHSPSFPTLEGSLPRDIPTRRTEKFRIVKNEHRCSVYGVLLGSRTSMA